MIIPHRSSIFLVQKTIYSN